MTISVKVVAHSRVSGSPDLITLEARYNRAIHSELMTHRLFSRNASSSRAIPIEKMIQSVIDDPAMPVAWGSNKPGMQAGEEIDTLVKFRNDAVPPEAAWLRARDNAVTIARAFAAAGYHKQIGNRLLEPFGHITVVITATEWSNFFDLRCHPDADPTMRALAEAMRDAIEGSAPTEPFDGWHLPYIQSSDIDALTNILSDPEHGASHLDYLPMISAARAARVSYLTHSGDHPSVEKDLALADRLRESKHASPFEHQAQADPEHLRRCEHGNFTGWIQHRQILGL